MKQKYKVQMVAGIFLLLASNVLAFLSVCPEDPLTPMRYLVPVGLALVIIPVLRHRRYGNEPYKDERTNNIITRGFVYSWYLTIGVMVALFVVDDVGVLIAIFSRISSDFSYFFRAFFQLPSTS